MAIHYTTCMKRGGAGCFLIRNSAIFIRKTLCISVKLRINLYTWRHCAWAKKGDKTKEWTDYLSNKCHKFDGILMIYACSFGVLEDKLLSFGAMLAVCCPEWRGVRYSEVLNVLAISIGRAIGGMEFVHCTEVVRLSESPLLEVSL